MQYFKENIILMLKRYNKTAADGVQIWT